MEFTAEQHNFLDEPSRFFLMDARRKGLPVDAFHAFRKDSATMEVRLLSLVPVARLAGPDLTRAATVTLFNDLVLLAPGGLIDPSIEWESIGPRSIRARYTLGNNTIGADLTFDDSGQLVDFVSDDRIAASAEDGEMVRRRWSTPIGEYAGHRVPPSDAPGGGSVASAGGCLQLHRARVGGPGSGGGGLV